MRKIVDASSLRVMVVFVTVVLATAINFPSTLTGSAEVIYHPCENSVWHAAAWDDQTVVTADYQGQVQLRNLRNERVTWQYSTGAFVFDLAVADLNQDGHPEILVVTAEGDLIVLNPAGQLLWTFHSPLALFNVAVGNLQGDDQLEVVCGGIDRKVYVFDANGQSLAVSPEVTRLVHRLAVGNLDGGTYDEVLVIEARTIAHLMALKEGTLTTVWRKELQVPDDRINWENPRGNFVPFSLALDDLDGDGQLEILMGDTFFNKQAVMVLDNQGEPLWLSDGLPPFQNQDGSQLEFYSTAFVRAADLFPEIAGKEVVSVAGGCFRVWDRKGRLLASRNTRLGFTDLELLGNDLLLGSCPNGDNNFYQIKWGPDWEAALESMEFRGLIRTIKQNTADLDQRVSDYQGKPTSGEVYDVILGFGSVNTNEEGLEQIRMQDSWFRQQYPFPNLRLIRVLKVMEDTPPLDETGQPWSPSRWKVDSINVTSSVEEILEKARWIEAHQVPCLFYIGHSCMPFITLDTAEKILQAAPEYCLGFYTAEDEQVELIPRFFEYYFKPLANMCLRYGNKRCMTKNKGLWWITSPARPPVFDALFREGRNRITMAATEDSNSRTPEMNLMGRGGLWQAGLIQQNDVSIHSDLFSFNRFHQWEYPRVGHPYLRLLVAHATLGMTQVNSRIREYTSTRETADIETLGKESTGIFFKLLGKGLVFSPKPEDALGYSTVGLVMHPPPGDWLEDAHNGHSPEKWVEDEQLHQAVIPHNGSLWGMTNTPDHALQKILFNKQRQFGYQVPPTPYGLVAIVPAETDLSQVKGVKSWWHTDGVYAWKDGGSRLTGMEAATRMQADFAEAAQRLPFQQHGEPVFLNSLRVAQDHYRLFLIDPGWLDPADHEVTIEIHLEGEFTAQDTLNHRELSIRENRFTVDVPAGLFTIVDVRRIN